MKAPSEGEEGYRPPAPASQSKPAQSKLEALVERHEAASANPAHSVQERSDNLANTLQNRGFGCVSAFDKKAAAAAVEELKSDPHACPELIEQLKELGLDKLE